jgi:superfamily I DNA and/or RNA helicase
VSITSYEDRLESHAGTERQLIVGDSRWSGSALRMVPVQHTANASASAEEARVVAGVVEELLELQWTNCDGERHPVGPRDILIVAPYNAHVARLRETVPAGIDIGTVDKFQGREAAVVIYSMASSSAVDAPRGVEFLYDVHRLNVAVSRARAMTIVVCSPTLLDAEVSTPHQLRLVNALCRYAELAQIVSQEAPE